MLKVFQGKPALYTDQNVISIINQKYPEKISRIKNAFWQISAAAAGANPSPARASARMSGIHVAVHCCG